MLQREDLERLEVELAVIQGEITDNEGQDASTRDYEQWRRLKKRQREIQHQISTN